MSAAAAAAAPVISGVHVRMARAGLGWSVRELGAKADVNANTIVRIENGADALAITLKKIQAVLEGAGVEFLDSDAPGVRLRPRRRK